jgi:hypothetical protein
MRRFLILLLLASPARATTRYVANAAGTFTGGTNCNGQTAITVATFNGTSQSAGDLNWVCGTVTTSLAPTGSGGSGNPVVIRFDTGASIIKANCGTNGCINLNGLSNYLIDGSPTSTACGYVGQQDVSCNGLITSTNVGTGLTSTDSVGVYVRGGGSNVEIRNLAITNLYVMASTTDASASGNYYGVWTDGTNVHVHNCVIHDAYGAIKGEAGNNNSEYDHNQLYNSNWSVAVFGPSTNVPDDTTVILIHDNDMHDWAVWDNTSDDYHHDGCFAAGNNNLATGISHISCYNNYFHGSVSDPTACAGAGSGSCMTAHIYMNDGNHFQAYNNYIVASVAGQYVNNGFILFLTFGTLDANDGIWNNTVVGASGASGYCISIRGDASMDYRNNVLSKCHQLLNVSTSPATTFTNIDYNTYQNSSLTSAWQNGSSTYSTIAAWRTAISGETNAQATTGSLGLGGSGIPGAGSVVIGAGTNLTSLSLSALDRDALGVARPATGAWDAGAIQNQVSVVQPANAPFIF